MPADFATSRLQEARTSVRQVLDQWNPTDFDQLDASRHLLEQAVAGMRDFEAALRGGTVPLTGETRSELLILRKDIHQATRVVDACSAFHRGLAARLGNIDSGYDAGGRLFDEAPELENELHG